MILHELWRIGSSGPTQMALLTYAKETKMERVFQERYNQYVLSRFDPIACLHAAFVDLVVGEMSSAFFLIPFQCPPPIAVLSRPEPS